MTDRTSTNGRALSPEEHDELRGSVRAFLRAERIIKQRPSSSPPTDQQFKRAAIASMCMHSQAQLLNFRGVCSQRIKDAIAELMDAE